MPVDNIPQDERHIIKLNPDPDIKIGVKPISSIPGTRGRPFGFSAIVNPKGFVEWRLEAFDDLYGHNEGRVKSNFDNIVSARVPPFEMAPEEFEIVRQKVLDYIDGKHLKVDLDPDHTLELKIRTLLSSPEITTVEQGIHLLESFAESDPDLLRRTISNVKNSFPDLPTAAQWMYIPHKEHVTLAGLLSLVSINDIEIESLCISSIASVPSNIKSLKTLKHLVLLNTIGRGTTGTQTGDFTKAIQHFPQLESLVFNGCYTSKSIPGLSKCTKLEKIRIHKTQMRGLPDGISQVTNLSTLDCSETNLEFLPNDFKQLQNLRTLKINNNRLKEFPEGFESLKKLHELDLFNFNKISRHEEKKYGWHDIKKFRIPPNITSLKIDFKNFAKFFPVIQDCQRLRSLSLDGSHVGFYTYENPTVNMLPGLTELEELNLTNVGINEIHPNLAGMSKLKTLHLANRLKEIPEEVLKLPSLKNVTLSKEQPQIISAFQMHSPQIQLTII